MRSILFLFLCLASFLVAQNQLSNSLITKNEIEMNIPSVSELKQLSFKKDRPKFLKKKTLFFKPLVQRKSIGLASPKIQINSAEKVDSPAQSVVKVVKKEKLPNLKSLTTESVVEAPIIEKPEVQLETVSLEPVVTKSQETLIALENSNSNSNGDDSENLVQKPETTTVVKKTLSVESEKPKEESAESKAEKATKEKVKEIKKMGEQSTKEIKTADQSIQDIMSEMETTSIDKMIQNKTIAKALKKDKKQDAPKKKRKKPKKKKERNVEKAIDNILNPENAEPIPEEERLTNEDIEKQMKEEQNVIGDNIQILDNLLGSKGIPSAGQKSTDLPNFGQLLGGSLPQGKDSKVQENVNIINSLIRGKLNVANQRKFATPKIPKPASSRPSVNISKPKTIPKTQSKPYSGPSKKEVQNAKPELQMTIGQFQKQIGQGQIGRGPMRNGNSQQSISPQIEQTQFPFLNNNVPSFGPRTVKGPGGVPIQDPTQIPLFGQHLVKKPAARSSQNSQVRQRARQPTPARPAPKKKETSFDSFDFGSGGFSDFGSFDLDNFIDKPQNEAQERLDVDENLKLKGKVPALKDFPTFQEFLKNGALPNIPGLTLPKTLDEIKKSDKNEEELSKELTEQIKIIEGKKE